MNSSRESQLMEKIKQLSLEQIQQVEQLVDRLNQDLVDSSLNHTLTQLSESAFAKVWDNPEDSIYDDL